MANQSQGIWCVQRNIKFSTPNSEVQVNPSSVLRDFLWGHIFLTKTPNAPAKRNFYGGSNSGFQTGIHSYNLIIALPDDLKSQMSGITIYKRGALGEKPIKLPEVNEEGEFTHAFVPPDAVEILLPYTIIYGGLADGNEDLQELYIGYKAKESLPNITFSEDTEGTNPFYRK